MTWVPTPKADLIPLAQLDGALTAVTQQILSRLHHSEQDHDFLASAVADLYASLNGVGGVWLWSGAAFGTDPGSGRVLVTITQGNNRTIALSKTDGDGNVPSLATLGAGSTLVLTDDPASAPTTAFRQYLVTSDPTDHGSWISMLALRLATFGNQDTPTVGTSVRLLVR